MRGKDMVALGPRGALEARTGDHAAAVGQGAARARRCRYPYELREAKDYFYDIADVKVEPELLTLAQHILKTKEARFDPTKFVDRYEQAVLQMLDKKQQGAPAPKARPFVAPTNVVSLMDALRQSMADRGNGGRRT